MAPLQAAFPLDIYTADFPGERQISLSIFPYRLAMPQIRSIVSPVKLAVCQNIQNLTLPDITGNGVRARLRTIRMSF
jgi:hypothetical protein